MIKVLVVDRTGIVEELTKQTLLPLGCQVIKATSTALGIFLARKNLPSLIINGTETSADLELPQEIHADCQLENIPVVVVLISNDETLLSSARESGAVKALTQPISPERFFEELRPYLIESPEDRLPETAE